MQPSLSQPMSLTLSPKLDAAVAAGWQTFESAAGEETVARLSAWIARRLRNPAIADEIVDPVERAFTADDQEDQAVALAELAEIAAGHDDLLADTLWEGVLAAGFDLGDADVIADAVSNLAAIAEDHGEPLAAAEYFIDFLNWRRTGDAASDPELVETAFDEIIRLAELDGDPRATALFTHRQAQFTRLLEKEDERADAGNWESSAEPYTSWA